MKLNKFGINIDEGLPLRGEALQRIYEPCFAKEMLEVEKWINDTSNSFSMLLGGQIGSGKTTLLNKLFFEKKYEPFITINFDKESLNLDEGDFLSIVLAQFLSKANEESLNLSSLKIPFSLFGITDSNYKALSELLVPRYFSLESFEKKRTARKIITEKAEYFIELISRFAQHIFKEINKPFFIFVSGVDKFNSKSSAFYSLKSSLEILSKFKTLFETNAVHLFLSDEVTPFKNNPAKLFITTIDTENILNILTKRMGIYSQSAKEELELISKWSGGNPRQGIRILEHYLAFQKISKITKAEKITKAIKKTTEDFFAYATKPSLELIKIIERDKKLDPSLINLPGDKETAQEAVYGNWIFIAGDPSNGKWPSIVNPLVISYYEEKSIITESPEHILLKIYAETHGLSPTGLDFKVIDESGKSRTADEILYEYLSSGVEEPFPLKLTEILDLISAALLSKDRKDRIIIAYKNKEVLNAARSYIFAKANTYEYQTYFHEDLKGGDSFNPIRQLKEYLQNDVDIFSFDFTGDWTNEQLDILNKHRDNLLNYQMIWWIPLKKIKKYLPHWVQLRELFEFYILEDEILGSLSQEDIESDISFFKELAEKGDTAESELVKNLKIVLDFLKKGGKNG